jgi:hypothetical protein
MGESTFCFLIVSMLLSSEVASSQTEMTRDQLAGLQNNSELPVQLPKDGSTNQPQVSRGKSS